MLSHAPGELTGGRLRRLAEGVGKVVYASEHWVVKRERPASEVIALIAVWKLLRGLAHILPARLGKPLLRRPSKLIRPLRLLMQAVVLVVPRSVWMMTHIGEVWRVHRTRDIRGARLAKAHLTGTSLIPERVTFPPVRVSIGGWPGWLVASEAAERVEGTLYQRLDRSRPGRLLRASLSSGWIVSSIFGKPAGNWGSSRWMRTSRTTGSPVSAWSCSTRAASPIAGQRPRPGWLWKRGCGAACPARAGAAAGLPPRHRRPFQRPLEGGGEPRRRPPPLARLDSEKAILWAGGGV